MKKEAENFETIQKRGVRSKIYFSKEEEILGQVNAYNILEQCGRCSQI